ncbi:hypothetical protein [Candidatus Amarobacter glycogenicus]|uniref:hypothetical protein n=1 Tax=Candidatus Amarobacter glycogenicus TaxID=3140699 RepID=UPI0031CC5AC6
MNRYCPVETSTSTSVEASRPAGLRLRTAALDESSVWSNTSHNASAMLDFPTSFSPSMIVTPVSRGSITKLRMAL